MDNVTYRANRRQFLKTGAILGTGLLISFSVPLPGCKPGGEKTPEGPKSFDEKDIFVPNAYLSIRPDNTIKVLLSHQEMGQGIWTSLTMFIADELDANFKDIIVEHAPPGDAYLNTLLQVSVTGGSTTTISEFQRYRMAGATARAMLLTAAAQRTGVDISKCRTEDGHVIAGDKKIPFGDLASDASKLPPPKDVKPKDPKDWKYIGKGVKRLDAKAKTNGTAKFGIDMRGENLLIAVVLHSPYIGGKVISFDDSATKAIRGVKNVVQIPTGIAVLATDYWTAMKGKKALKVVWDKGPNTGLNTKDLVTKYRAIAATDGATGVKKGDYKVAMKKAVKTVKGEYAFPYLAHAPMEPMNCTVKLSVKDGFEIWTGTQMPGYEQAAAAKVLGVPKEDVKINTMFLGGGFGRRGNFDTDFVIEATEIAKASVEFIKMVWSREDDMTAQYYRPLTVHNVTVGLDSSGLPISWHHNVVGQGIYVNSFPFLIKNGWDPSVTEGVTESQYQEAIPNMFVGCHLIENPVKILWWRSVGNNHTAYVMETMIDQLAHAAGRDPVAYRRELLQHAPRSLGVLNVVAEKAEWDKPLPAGRYRGIAVHTSFKSYVAEVVEISLEGGDLKVHKVTCAIDCGLAVNPDGVRMQMESCIIFGLSMALYGEITIEGGQVMQHNFYDYKVARMNETPQMDIHLVPNDGEMGGVGEPGLPPLAPALANAIFAATGEMIYDLPLMNHKLKPA